jgi:hypothetical protein
VPAATGVLEKALKLCILRALDSSTVVRQVGLGLRAIRREALAHRKLGSMFSKRLLRLQTMAQ